jgi:hypothetical protein
MYGDIYITSKQARRYIQRDPNSSQYCDKDSIYLLVVDALAMSRHWPEYAIMDGVIYRRSLACAMPPDVSYHSHFGCREYQKVEDQEEIHDLKYALNVKSQD